jgi:integrase
LLEEGADLRFVKDQMGHSSIEETEGTYGHLELERHEPRVAPRDDYLTDASRVQARPPASTTEKIAR